MAVLLLPEYIEYTAVVAPRPERNGSPSRVRIGESEAPCPRFGPLQCRAERVGRRESEQTACAFATLHIRA